MKGRMLLAVSLFLSVLPSFGQDWETKATVNVPFEFVVGKTVLPAGDYAILTSTRMPSELLIKSVTTAASVFSMSQDIVLTPGGSTAPSSKLVFALDGDRHVLHQ